MATIVAQATGSFSATGTWTGGVVPGAGDIAQTGNYIVTIDASITCTLNPTGSGYFQVTSGGITITGDLVMQSNNGNGGLQTRNTTGTVSVTGTVTGGSQGFAACHFNAGTLVISASTGGNTANAYGVANVGAGEVIVGTATAGAGTSAHGAFNAAAGTLTVDLAVGNNWGVGGSGGYAYGVYGNGVAGQMTRVKRTQSGPHGAPAIGGAVLMLADASNSAQFRTAYGGGTLTLVDATSDADFPAVSDVRAGVEFDDGDKIGTAHIPDPANVAYGIPVDNTAGTAVLTAAGVTAAVWDAARSGHATDGTFGDTAEWAGSVDEAAIATAAAAAILVTPANKLVTDASGNAAANVTHHAGVAVAAADLNGNVPVIVKAWYDTPVPEPNTAGYPDIGTLADISLQVSQQVRDAMKLAPSAGAPAAGSVDKHLDDILEDTGTTLPGLIAPLALETTAQAVLAATARNGAGSIAWTYTLTSDVDAAPIPQARIEVWNAANNVLITQAYTDNNGQALFYLDPGTYSLRRTKAGWHFINPDTETVEEPAP